MNKRISKKNAQKWANALRSGEYKQTRSHLQFGDEYCCLGVACKIFIPLSKQRIDRYGELLGGLPKEQPHAPEWLKKISEDLYKRTGTMLLPGKYFTGLNDVDKYSFDEIADIIELVYVHGALD